MTEFRSKGKGDDRKVYPIKKRKPFGIAKNVAYKDVIALRKQGKRARLIETNRRLDLYAPYEATIQSPTSPISEPKTAVQKPAPSMSQSESGPTVQKTESHDKTVNADNVPIVTHEAEMAKKLISSVASDKKYNPYSIYSKGDKTYVATVDNNHIMMYYAEMGGVTQSPETPVGHSFQVPKLDLQYPNIIVSELTEYTQKQLLEDIKKTKTKKSEEPVITIYKPENSSIAYIGLISHEGGERTILNKPIPIPVKEAGHQPIISFYPTDYFKHAIAGLRHIDKELGIKHTNISIGLKEDYPMRMIAGNNIVSYNAIIAPRMEDDSYWFRSAIDKAIKEGVSA